MKENYFNPRLVFEERVGDFFPHGLQKVFFEDQCFLSQNESINSLFRFVSKTLFLSEVQITKIHMQKNNFNFDCLKIFNKIEHDKVQADLV